MADAQEQRRSNRLSTWMPVTVGSSHARARISMTHNVSERGVLLVSTEMLQPGEPVVINYCRSVQEKARCEATGRVVRAGLNKEDPKGLWPYRMAVEFDAPIEEFTRVMPVSQSQMGEA